MQEASREFSIHRVHMGDEADLARIQTESWKVAFKDILPPEVLTQRTNLEWVTTMYRHLLEQDKGNGYLLRVDGEPHCIAWWDAPREDNQPGCAEIICIHSLPGRWHQGYGSKMMERLLKDIAEAGCRQVMLWVFRDNIRARRFYEKHGFITQGRLKKSFGTVEICYQREL